MCASREERKKTNNKESFHGWPISLQADTVPSTADDEESRLADGAEAAAVPLLLASLEVAPPLGVEAAWAGQGEQSRPAHMPPGGATVHPPILCSWCKIILSR